ncbi:response regulator transcription factor [Microlunatus flavus]|uniref:DNA-binding response regulator, OmpR family, contains REC and winged-helix (WHTH) domain n=1 Tax=Microlunatus flavus TaxID=1036181 RepID=A0A1H9D7Z1_9ACTN|nr:response regulator transcription factor [Microlunatus flavus]SEQ09570.1 DNA-binding response regulator, OmpR family, contains REC and winged-helix (wHTH) domain [Microlunatus flavus]
MAAEPERVAVVIEDDADIRNLLAAILDQAGFRCHTCESGQEGIAAVRAYDPILTTLDISLPGIDGFEVARQIRAFSSTYIIMLSARDEEIDTLMGLDAGADDYLTKPFRPRELRARIEAMLRRYVTPVQAAAAASAAEAAPAPVAAPKAAAPPEPEEDSAGGWLSHNGLRINSEMWLVDLDGAPLELTRSEFDLLLAIMSGNRRVISKDTLALELRGDYATSGYVSDSDRRAVEVHMANLRRKLNDPVASPRYIETVRGVGYRLADARR